MSEKESKSVIAGYLQKLDELTGSEASEGNYAYRGQENTDWGVESGAFRRIKKPNPSKEDFISYHEKELLEPARMDRYGVGDGRDLSDLELLAELQHYGAATCLIDFTRNFFVAMWFACQSHKEKDGKIFILKTSDEKNFLSLEEKDLEKEVRSLLTFPTRDETISSKETTTLSLPKPSWWHWSSHGLIQRILKQDSLFIFGQPKIEGTLLQAIEIEHGHKDKILKELERLGITERTLFKDLPGFAESHGHNRPLPLGYGNAEYYLRKGNEALQRDDFEGAMADYNEAIKLNSEYAGAYNNRGVVNLILGYRSDAIADYNRVIELDPDVAEAYNNRGLVKSDLGDHTGAMADYDRVIELNPNFTEAYNNRGLVKSDLGDHTGAMADYDRAIKLNPNYAEAYNNRGIVKADLGDHSGAVADYDRAIGLKPDDAEAYNNRGNVKSDLGDHRGAIADYDRAIEFKPDYAEAYNNRGLARGKLGGHDGTEADRKRVAGLKNDDEEAYNNRENTKRGQVDYLRAIVDYVQVPRKRIWKSIAAAFGAIFIVSFVVKEFGYNRENVESDLDDQAPKASYRWATDPDTDSELAHTGREIAKLIRGDYYGAIADYVRTVELNPDDAEAYNNRGVAKDNLNDYRDAIADYSRFIALDPDDTETYFGRRFAKGELDYYYDAIANFSRVIELAPDFAFAYSNRGLAKLRLGDHDGAIVDFDRAIELKLDDVDVVVYTLRGLAKFIQDDHEGAKADYGRIIELNPDFAAAYLLRSLAKFIQDDHEGAIADYDKAIELKPELVGDYQSRERAKSALGDEQGAREDRAQARDIELDPEPKWR